MKKKNHNRCNSPSSKKSGAIFSVCTCEQKLNWKWWNTLFFSFFYKHTVKLGWSSVCLRFSRFESEIMLDGMLNFKTHYVVWYCVWYEHCNGLFNIWNLVSSLILMFVRICLCDMFFTLDLGRNESDWKNSETGKYETLIFPKRSLEVTKLSKFQHFFLFKIILSSMLMVVPSSSVNMKRFSDGNVKLCRLSVVIIVISYR